MHVPPFSLLPYHPSYPRTPHPPTEQPPRVSLYLPPAKPPPRGGGLPHVASLVKTKPTRTNKKKTATHKKTAVLTNITHSKRLETIKTVCSMHTRYDTSVQYWPYDMTLIRNMVTVVSYLLLSVLPDRLDDLEGSFRHSFLDTGHAFHVLAFFSCRWCWTDDAGGSHIHNRIAYHTTNPPTNRQTDRTCGLIDWLMSDHIGIGIYKRGACWVGREGGGGTERDGNGGGGQERTKCFC